MKTSARVSGAAAVIAAAAVIFWWGYSHWQAAAAGPAALPQVVVSVPLQRELDTNLGFLGQFAPVEQVELRAQVGGTITAIHFKDGEIVRKGDLLFAIDAEPYQIKLAQADSQLETAAARLELAKQEYVRAQGLKSSDAGSQQNVDQKAAEQRGAQAAVDAARAQIRDARFDVDHCRITAPFAGRIGTHLVSVGNLIAGSRAATSPTTLLATLVSLDPIWINFDMSESDYLTFASEQTRRKGPLASKVELALGDENEFRGQGTLDFMDNMIDRSSGTLHARATVPNPGSLLTPGQFARVRLALGAPVATLLVPDAAVLPDQSQHLVLTVAGDGTVTPKQVQVGDLRGGLRVIRSGLLPSDRVIIEGIPYAAPGSKVSPRQGAIQFAANSQE
jgi:multidrug efflux system membrane fusion protein